MKFAQSSDRTQVAYSSSGRGSSLLLVHGTATDHRRWQPVLPELASEYTVHAMDRRGRGASGDNPVYELSREFEDILAVIEAIGTDVLVVAHSFGAICALEAARLNGRIKRLVLYEPPIPSPSGAAAALDGDRAIQDLIDRGDDEGALVTFYRDVTRMPPAELAALRVQPSWADRVAMVRSIPREMRAARDYRFAPERFRDLPTSILLLLGGDSPPLFSSAIELLSANLPKISSAILPGQQHQAINVAPALFLAPVLSFLRS